MQDPSSSPAVYASGRAPDDSEAMTEFLDGLTGLGGELFSDDGSVPCGLMFQAEGKPLLFCSASPEVWEIFAAHRPSHALGQGPAPRALAAPGMQVVDDTSDPTHPSFFQVPASLGFASILSVPLNLLTEGRVALAFYARLAGFFTADRQRSAFVFAEQSRRAIELTLDLARTRDLAEHMRAAMDSRTSIDQAIGIIMAQNRCPQDEAFAVLKRASSTRNIKLRDLAASIVEQAGGQPPQLHFTP